MQNSVNRYQLRKEPTFSEKALTQILKEVNIMKAKHVRGIKRHSTNAIISLTEKPFIAYRRSFDVWHRGTELPSA